MKFLKLNKLNEDFFDNDNEVKDDSKQYDENVENYNKPIFERKDIFTQSCEIITTINIINFQQADFLMKNL